VTPTLTDGVVTLRPWRAEDVDPLVALCDDPEIVRFTRVPTPYTRDDALMYLAQQVAVEERGEATAFAIADAADDRLLGSIDVRRGTDGRATIGYLVGATARGRGVASRATRLLSRWALAQWGVARLEIHVRPDNPASQRVAERAGFTREAVLRSYLELRGRRYDSVVFSLLPDDVGSAP
jgi:RimJ/RimL family protein N-acetyltransferase